MNQKEVSIDKRIEIWVSELKNHIYEPMEEVQWKSFYTTEMLTIEEALKQEFMPVNTGDKWGRMWEYGWFITTITLPKWAEGKCIYITPNMGDEMLVYINGEPAGAVDLGRDGIIITHKGRAGDRYTVTAECYAGHGERLEHGGPIIPEEFFNRETPSFQITVKPSFYGIWDKEIFDIFADVTTLYRLYLSLEERFLRKQKIKEGLMEFTKLADFELPKEERFPIQQIKAVLKPLLDCHNGSTAPELTIIGQSHLDLAWKWPFAETRRKCGRTLSTQLTLMDEYEDYKFLLCEPVITESIKKDYPTLYKKIKEKFLTGQIIPEGGMWVESDTNIPSGESLIRQCTFGHKWFLEEFGIETQMLWLPDCFGFSGQLPQIMKGCKINYFTTQKLSRALQGNDKFPYNDFYWEGIDGTEILTHFYRENNAKYDPYALNKAWNQDRVQEENIDTLLFPFGYGDGGGGPTRQMLEIVKRTKDLEGAPRTTMESPIAFFKKLEQKKNIKNRYKGDIYLPWHRGVYTAESFIKAANRRAEFALRDLEITMVICKIFKVETINAEELTQKVRELWEKLLFNQFHDVIAGTSIARVHEEAREDLIFVKEEANKLKEQLLNSLAPVLSKETTSTNDTTNINNTINTDETLSLLNTLSSERKECIPLPDSITTPCDSQGNTLLVQKGKTGRYCTVTIPPFSAVTIYNNPDTALITKEENTREASFIKASITKDNNNTINAHMENSLLKIKINSKGEITSIFDKASGIEFVEAPCNKFRMYKDVNIEYDAWELTPYYDEMELELTSPASIEVIEEGEEFASLRITKNLHKSQLTQDIILYKDSKRIDFNTTINWKEMHKILKVDFPVQVYSEEAFEEIQFGYVKRPTHQSRNFDKDRYEVCNHKYTALSEHGRTFALLNDSKYGISVRKNNLQLTLLRAPVIPDKHSDQGTHTFTYAIYPDTHNFYESQLIKEAYQINVPLTTTLGNINFQSLLELTNQHIILETLKPADDGSSGIILRMYESKGGHCSTHLWMNFPVTKAHEVSMLETIEEGVSPLPLLKEEKGNQNKTGISLDFTPFEIKTLRIQL